VSVRTSSPKLLADYGRACAHALARAHARTGDRIAIAAYLGSSDAADTALARFAEAYADQNEHDFTALRDAVAAGRVTAKSDL
jgi:thiamine monophosphate kinase